MYREVHHVVCSIFSDPRFAQVRDFSKSAQEEGFLLQALRLYCLGRVPPGAFHTLHTVASSETRSESPCLPALTDASMKICTVFELTLSTAAREGSIGAAYCSNLHYECFRRGLPQAFHCKERDPGMEVRQGFQTNIGGPPMRVQTPNDHL